MCLAPRLRLVLAVLAGLTLVVPLAPALAAHDVVPARVAGETRFETAAEVARLQFPQGTSTAIVATSVTFPDALAGASLAGAADAPVLLVQPDDVPDPTSTVLADLGVENVYILGGPRAVSDDVEAELRERYEVVRLAGESRFGTAAEIAAETARLQGRLGEIAGLTTAFVANGRAFPDALAAGSPATTEEDAFPILLVESDTYPAETEQAIADLGIEQVIIVGGPQAVDEHVERHLAEDTRAVLRVAGDTREETAVAVAEFAMRQFDYTGELVVLARSDDFPDALAAGLHAGRHDAPILLTPPDALAQPTAALLHDLCPAVEAVRAVGGRVAISAATLDEAVHQAEDCHATEFRTGETYRVEPGRQVEVSAGDAVDLSVTERWDGRPVQEPLDVTLFPCDAVDRGTGTFADADGDGLADDIAATTTGAATIESATEADRVEPRYAHDARFLHGALSWTLRSGATDCTVTVVFDDRDGDDQLRVDSEGNALEHYGARKVSWS
ncbi:MAG: cell wall-binding repeat-containing protein [Actinobacteria bacterium]|nr:cell wall-binding repeat-containing protein [Actinomycetota bacterium]